jgi:preprotein translocase subunit YajC
MRKLARWMILMLVVSLAAATVVFAGGPNGRGAGGGPGGVGKPGGLSGRVTAVAADSLTVLKSDSTSVTVKTSSSTKVEILATGATGSLSDVVVGSPVQVRGPQGTDGNVTAEVITLLPAADQLGGRVTAINAGTITVQAQGGTSATIVTSTATTFRKDQAAASLSDVQVGQELRAYGTLQSDGSLSAVLVLIQGARGGGPGGAGGPHGGH